MKLKDIRAATGRLEKANPGEGDGYYYLGPFQEEARCPMCRRWSLVAWDDTIPPGGFWWANGFAGCPKCGATVLVESECDFRPARTLGNLGYYLRRLWRWVRR